MNPDKGNFELEAPPPDLRDLSRLCHPRLQSQNQNRRGSAANAASRPGLAPEVSAQVASLQSLTLCSGQVQRRRAIAVRQGPSYLIPCHSSQQQLAKTATAGSYYGLS